MWDFTIVLFTVFFIKYSPADDFYSHSFVHYSTLYNTQRVKYRILMNNMSVFVAHLGIIFHMLQFNSG